MTALYMPPVEPYGFLLCCCSIANYITMKLVCFASQFNRYQAYRDAFDLAECLSPLLSTSIADSLVSR